MARPLASVNLQRGERAVSLAEDDAMEVLDVTVLRGRGSGVSLPDFQTLMLPLLRCFAEGSTRVADCIPAIQREFGISDEDAAQPMASGPMPILLNRAHWARTYMSKAGLLSSPERGKHAITAAGRQVLGSKPSRIDIKSLSQSESFRTWRFSHAGGVEPTSSVAIVEAEPRTPQPASTETESTPEEAMQAAHDLLGATLRDDLLAQLADLHPIRFERLILDLLSAMGFGGGDLSRTRMTKASGDGGIDGIIHEDALGLDRVYVQAKRYGVGKNVAGPAIREFAGSLTEQGAAKGVFVTTSDFTKDARGVAAKITHHRIVLIDGQELARLMIRYGVGIRARTTFVVHGIDEDYFRPAAGE